MANLFTSQTPASADNSDGAPGITTATTVVFAADGTVTGIRFYATATVSGTYVGALWTVDSSDPGGGTLKASKTLGVTPTGGAWNTITFDTPVAVTAGVAYRAGLFSGAGRYVATSGFFASGLTNGSITAPVNGATVGSVVISQGTFRIDSALDYPNATFGSASYFVDVEYSTGGPATVTADAALAVTATVSAGAARTALPAAALSATATLAAGASRTALPIAALATTATLTAGTARQALPAAALTATVTLTAGATVGAAPATAAAALTVTASLTTAGTRVTSPAAALPVSAALSAGAGRAALPTAAIAVTATLVAGVNPSPGGGSSAPGPAIRTTSHRLVLATTGYDRTLRTQSRGG
ncbi:DUF4082 domain-containing protein [Actinoplanes palleronii]|uniref:DUF4082 domain-containing protein n=1 Tax=Actinoplanes palleronii TaxID=113570 RepID=A0ABQ4B411_9ACTN|nr:DUF4082 domain-containing protein [Actinoplanes palleronii]GIE65402.1 hypothetical protein Apa02nite_015100 [Actinoplanes palleronii]